jgi:hypothetical protein
MTRTARTGAQYGDLGGSAVRPICEHLFVRRTQGSSWVREPILCIHLRKTPISRQPGGEAEILHRLAAAPGLSTGEAHKLAGLLDAEGHLGIVPNNGDGWRCHCSVNLRDDDRDVLEDFRAKLGIGRLNQVSARNGSRPQVVWKIASKVECQVLVDLLDVHPLRGRKRAEYEIWREAVGLWGSQSYGWCSEHRPRLDALAGRIGAARAYQAPVDDAPLPDLSDEWAFHYFAGFFSGEGCFGLGERNARTVIKVRRDDRPLLDALSTAFGIGTVCDVSALEPWSPAAVWHVTRARDVRRAISIFDQVGLLGRKGRQYAAWKPGAEAVAQAILTKSPLDRTAVEAARRDLARATAYRPPAAPLAGDHAPLSAAIAYVAVLRAWAAEAEGPLSCSSYADARRTRHPEWPQRETISRAFGTWYYALRCAGLQDQATKRSLSLVR